MSAVDRAAHVIAVEYGPCNDDVNHTGREARHAAEALAESDLLVTDEVRAVLDAAVHRAQVPDDLILAYLASRPS